MSERSAAAFAAEVDASADMCELTDDQREQLREHATQNAHDVANSDGFSWVGARVAGNWLESCGWNLRDGEQMPSWSQYEERRAESWEPHLS